MHPGYDCFAARRVEEIMRAAGLEIVESRGVDDAEFSFAGAAPEHILRAWEGRCARPTHALPPLHPTEPMPCWPRRFGRMKMPQQHFGDALEARKRAFLDCLASPEHTTTSQPRLVIGRKY